MDGIGFETLIFVNKNFVIVVFFFRYFKNRLFNKFLINLKIKQKNSSINLLKSKQLLSIYLFYLIICKTKQTTGFFFYLTDLFDLTFSFRRLK